MSNSAIGWIQIASFVVTGALVIACAVGVRRALHPGRAATWGPLLLAVYGLGLIGAGAFFADPMDGFPPGTPLGPPVVMSWHGPLHFVAGGIGFIALIAACLVFARRFAADGEAKWAGFSLATGVLFLAGFVGIGSGSKLPWVNLAFTATVVLVWVWLSALSLHLLTGLRRLPRWDGRELLLSHLTCAWSCQIPAATAVGRNHSCLWPPQAAADAECVMRTWSFPSAGSAARRQHRLRDCRAVRSNALDDGCRL